MSDVDYKFILYLNKVAQKYFAEEEYGLAIGVLDKLIDIDPTDDSNYCHRGWAQFYRGEYDKALRDFNEALRLNPKNKLALKFRDKFNEVLRLAPDNKRDKIEGTYNFLFGGGRL